MRKFFLIIIVLLAFLFGGSYVSADTPSPTPTPTPSTSSKAQELQKQINDLQAKINELKSQEKTLSSQIAVMDNQIKLTALRINATKQQIADLTLDIDTANKKIDNIEKSLDNLTKVLFNRIVATYKIGSASSFQILIASSDVSDFVERTNYLRIAQAHDKRLIYDTVQAKNDYANQKNIFEQEKKRIEALNAQLQRYTAELSQEKADKDALLRVTQNDESIYQQKLQAALAEQVAIQQITSGGGNAVLVGDVKEGDVVGHVISGASSCSSGTHLHFEVRHDGALQDPSGSLSSHGVTFDNSPDGSFGFSGSWQWPLADPIYIEQGYGMTYWARNGWYGGGPHTGIDMYSSSSNAVKVVKDGQLYRGGITCGGGQLLFSRVDQAGGIQTFYLHILP